MDVRSSSRPQVMVDEIVKSPKKALNRRKLIKLGLLGAGAAATTLAGIDALVWEPQRAAVAQRNLATLPSIQFDLSNFLPPARTIDGIEVRLPAVYTVFLTATLGRSLHRSDQHELENALRSIENAYPFSPQGIHTTVSYGIPYFSKLPGGMGGRLVRNTIPRMLSHPSRLALEEAVPGPTDVTADGHIKKQRFNVPVSIEKNDVLFVFRSDRLSNIQDTISFLKGSDRLNGKAVSSPAFHGLFHFTSMRTMFLQIGLPLAVAQQHNLPFTARMNPQSPMWMGFGDQQVSASGPAAITTFQGNASARLTNANSHSYFADGAIHHLSHVIQDLEQWYADDEPYSERVQYMFRSCPFPSRGNDDQFTAGGGPAWLPNDSTVFLKTRKMGVSEATLTAATPNVFNDPQEKDNPATIEARMGHLSALQQSSRASDGTPLHIRTDGPGFDSMDIPDGSNQPKLQFSVYVPTADFFRTMRINQAALKFQQAEEGFGGNANGTVEAEDNGLERFLSATRRQNFLIPPRRHRAFPLLELT